MDIQTSLRDLVLFCSRRDPSAWRELWQWRYADVVEFHEALIADRIDENERMDISSVKSFEQLNALYLQLIASKL